MHLRSHWRADWQVPLALAMAPATVVAHEGHDHATSFAAGLVHPLGGADHWMAMLLVGVWAAWLGGRARWALPLSFMLAMLGGGWLAVYGFGFAAVETAVALSLVFLGAALLAAWRAQLPLALALVLLSGMAHGMAHVADVGASALAQVAPYAAGFVLATGLLHLLGLLLATRLQRWRYFAPMQRVVGAATAGFGLVLIL
jgi:urease accessory protein